MKPVASTAWAILMDDLVSNPFVIGGQVDLDNIQFVRLVDIPGNGAFLDSQGNPILDAWLTSGAGGFDFRLGEGIGVGVINASTVPEPGSLAILLVVSAVAIFRRRRCSERLFDATEVTLEAD